LVTIYYEKPVVIVKITNCSDNPINIKQDLTIGKMVHLNWYEKPSQENDSQDKTKRLAKEP
jgi:hypothetical protein